MKKLRAMAVFAYEISLLNDLIAAGLPAASRDRFKFCVNVKN